MSLDTESGWIDGWSQLPDNKETVLVLKEPAEIGKAQLVGVFSDGPLWRWASSGNKTAARWWRPVEEPLGDKEE